MARKPPNPSGSWPPKAKKQRSPFAAPKAEDWPAPRDLNFEELLCRAIEERFLVTLTYKDDLTSRTFAPHAVYHSTQNKVCVSGTQTADDSPHNFEVGKITSLHLTETKFEPDRRFDRTDLKYRNGIICSV